jgi:hypothetical protein
VVTDDFACCRRCVQFQIGRPQGMASRREVDSPGGACTTGRARSTGAGAWSSGV